MALSDVSISCGTSGSAFSLIVTDAEVCKMKTCKSPARRFDLRHCGDHFLCDEVKPSATRFEGQLSLIPTHLFLASLSGIPCIQKRIIPTS